MIDYVQCLFVCFLCRASALLEELPGLGRVRRKLVPSRLSEEEFWARFFSIVREAVLLTLGNSQ